MEDLPAGSKLGFDDVVIRPRVSTLRSNAEINFQAETVFGGGGTDTRRLTCVPLALMPSVAPGQGDLNVLPVVAGMGSLIIVRDGPSYEAAAHGVEEGTIDSGLLIVASEAGDGVIGRIDAVMARVKARCILVEEKSGSTVTLIDACRTVRDRYPNHILIAGEIHTSDALEAVARESDADVVMLAPPWSSGPVGVPSFSMTSECARAGRAVGMKVMANVEKVCDVPKALAAGADFVAISAGLGSAPGIMRDAERALLDACMRTDCRTIRDLSSKATFQVCRKLA